MIAVLFDVNKDADDDMNSILSRQVVFSVAVPVFSVAILLALLELVARLFLTVYSFPQTHYDYRKEQPAPYSEAAYFSQEFISESFHQPDGWQYPEGTRLIIPNDYRGKYFNVVDGKRRTEFQPDNYENTIYLFGGSTIYNSEVPDGLTIASQLQLLFNEYYGERYIVQNYGTTTVTAVQQLERLMTLSPEPGDIVIFYDGVNDINQGVFYANPEETMIERNRRVMTDLPLLQKVMFALPRKSMFVQLFIDPVDRSIPAHFSDDAFMKDLLVSMRSRFRETIESAHDYAENNKAIFFHFLQPHLFADENFSEYETQLSENFFIIPRGLKEAFHLGYPDLMAVTEELSDSMYSYDISDVLDDRPHGREYFLDSCHVTHEANRVIARKIFDSLRRVLSVEAETNQPIEYL